MKKVVFIALFAGCFAVANAQGILGGKVTGNIQIDAQISKEDKDIGAPDVPEKLLSNMYGNIQYTNGGFTAGMRLESYQNPILGFDAKYKGTGIPFRFASYKGDMFEVTVGNFYEQFGNGLVFRSYQEPNMGLDNAMDGLNVKFDPIKGVYLKAFVGKQRYYWGYGSGVVRGIDGEVSINDLVKSFESSKTRVVVGGSFVSKYEDDELITTNIGGDKYQLKLPLNVGAWAARFNVSHGRFALQGEYAQKGQDPNAVNNFIYKKGEALFLSGSYSQKGLGVNIQAKRIDNMSFKSARSLTGEMLNINYLPALTKQHTYSLLAMYPYATQVSGEMGIQADVTYTIKKNTPLGGKYGMDIKLNYSRSHSIDKEKINEETEIGQMGTDGYKSDFFKIGDDLYYEDFNIEIGKRLTKNLKASLTYGYITFNPATEGHGEGGDLHYNNIVVGDVTYKINPKNVVRVEAEWLKSNVEPTDEDKRSGDWIMLLGEYNFASRYFVSLSDQYNYRGSKEHYYGISFGYNYGASRIQLTYGKQREGIICIGGVCRQVPASNGLMLSLTTSF
ncbi:DUF6029 family protein [Bacteroidales bacterium OttesenSCG-928-C19]|nr:DUF6029 family protein [Bacteroidales bacterium OttesenSCG-928-C19]